MHLERSRKEVEAEVLLNSNSKQSSSWQLTIAKCKCYVMNGGFKDLKVYQLAYGLAMDIFRTSKIFPVDEKYSLTDQIEGLLVQYVQI